MFCGGGGCLKHTHMHTTETQTACVFVCVFLKIKIMIRYVAAVVGFISLLCLTWLYGSKVLVAKQ